MINFTQSASLAATRPNTGSSLVHGLLRNDRVITSDGILIYSHVCSDAWDEMWRARMQVKTQCKRGTTSSYWEYSNKEIVYVVRKWFLR